VAKSVALTCHCEFPPKLIRPYVRGDELHPNFGPPEDRVFRLYHDGGLVAPPGFCNEIGTLFPIAP
jgi:hypothetical protein